MAGFFKIPADHVLVLCDDITQAPGKLRIRPSGSAGGHNGLKSIIARLGGENFPRIRIGIGAKPHPDYDLAAWVLGKFPPDDAKLVAGRHTDVEAACRLLMAGKLGGKCVFHCDKDLWPTARCEPVSIEKQMRHSRNAGTRDRFQAAILRSVLCPLQI